MVFMKKWIIVLIIIFVMIVTMISLAIVSLFDYISQEDTQYLKEDVILTAPDEGGVEFLENNVGLIRENS